ncbi:ammonium transporter 1 member 2 [Cinnamomum micranthum f. kanehirae]|uniref:Ammonium transporter 1 member 2 n=1 Tax=Cinnamomum micranthum f. kanehirae TaxID=337451 RepID=A0A443NRR4_9MAGN|nr:ammonium transporter 1 member 2 [Cinnamomum micranthum f. kanehirae]
MASLLLPASLPTTACSSSPTHSRSVHQNPLQLSLRFPLINPSSRKSLRTRTLTISFALAESDSPKSLDEEDDALSLLQELSDSFRLPSDYFAQLPGDLRLDLNDAAFDLANGPVLDECGQELGKMLLNLSQAWEQADTSTSTSIASKFPSLHGSLTDNVKSAFGKRLVSAGRRFQSMGQYGEGELQRIAKVMIKTGKLLSASPVTITDEKPKVESRMFKFGELQVELTPQKANIGAAIGFVYGILSWQLSKGIQSIPESSLQYANDNALLLAKSLRGALLALCYSSTILSALATVGLILLGRQLSSEANSKE